MFKSSALLVSYTIHFGCESLRGLQVILVLTTFSHIGIMSKTILQVFKFCLQVSDCLLPGLGSLLLHDKSFNEQLALPPCSMHSSSFRLLFLACLWDNGSISWATKDVVGYFGSLFVVFLNYSSVP